MKDRIPQRHPEVPPVDLRFNGSVFALRCQDLARSLKVVFSFPLARSGYMVFSPAMARSNAMGFSVILARSIYLVFSQAMARSWMVVFSRSLAYLISLRADDLNIPLDTAPLPATLQSCAMLHTGLSETS